MLKNKFKKRARKLRQTLSIKEKCMWCILRNRRLCKYKFIRQYAIGFYVADFVCREKKLIIELDGSQHSETITYDEQRTEYLQKRGYRVLRFWNNTVQENKTGVLDTILRYLSE